MSTLDVAKFVVKLRRAGTATAFIKEVVNVIGMIPRDSKYDRDYCDLVFRRVDA